MFAFATLHCFNSVETHFNQYFSSNFSQLVNCFFRGAYDEEQARKRKKLQPYIFYTKASIANACFSRGCSLSTSLTRLVICHLSFETLLPKLQNVLHILFTQELTWLPYFKSFTTLHCSGHTTDLQLNFDHLCSFKERCVNILQAVAFVRLSKT